jgi:hypothetical protein
MHCALCVVLDFVGHASQAKGVNFMSHMKSVQVITHVKPMVCNLIFIQSSYSIRSNCLILRLLDGVASES